MPVDDGVLAFVRGALPPPPARVLEVGAGQGELAAALRAMGWEVVAVDPAADGAPGVEPIPLLEVAGDDASFDAAVAIVSLHHVEPLAESCARLAALVRPGGVLAVDEFDVARFDERAAAWQGAQRAAAGRTAPDHPAAWVGDIRHHMHPVAEIRAALVAAGSTSASRSAARTSTAGTSTRRCAPWRSGSSPPAPCPPPARGMVGVRR